MWPNLLTNSIWSYTITTQWMNWINEKILRRSLLQTLSAFTWEMKWTQTGMRFNFGWKSHFGIESAIYLCLDELRRNENQTVWISYWSFWQKWNFISDDKISCKHYTKWNAYTCPPKYRVVLKCSQNETSCEQNLFSRRFAISNRYEFISFQNTAHIQNDSLLICLFINCFL